MMTVDDRVRCFRIEGLSIEVHPNRRSLGVAAALAAAEAMKQLSASLETFGVIFATGASQLETLDALTRMDGIPWNQVRGFHLDEYVGLAIEHRASFRRYLRENLTQKVHMKEFHEVDGTTADLDQFCSDYAEMLAAANPNLALLGVGENGHLAFNDPAVADFNDPQDVKVVELDSACRAQQVAEGWFNSVEQVPDSAISVTIPAILRVPKLILSVPGSRKAAIMRRTLREKISTDCPASVLRTHPDVTIYLDRESASELDDFFEPG